MRPVADALLSPEATLMEAISVIDRGGLQIALVVDREHRLVGLLNDGDVRRALLNGASRTSVVAPFINRDPITVRSNASPHELGRLMNGERRVLRVPALDPSGRLEGVFLIEDFVFPDGRRPPLVIMAGGLGTRLGEHTRSVPKPMVPVGGKPMLQHIIEKARQEGFTELHISIRHLGEQIVEHFGNGADFGVSISYIRETKRLGTAGALKLLAGKVDQPFVVVNGDVLTEAHLGSLVLYHYDRQAIGTMCVREHAVKVPYGVVMQDDGKLLSLKEKPTITQFVNAGIYMFDPEALDHIPDDQYFDMTSLFENLLASSVDRTAIFLLREYWCDVGTPDDLMQAREVYSES